jgi:hypothetical protein
VGARGEREWEYYYGDQINEKETISVEGINLKPEGRTIN